MDRIHPTRYWPCLFLVSISALLTVGCNPSKSTITGQVFIATSGGSSIRLGAVRVEICNKQQFDSFLDERKTEIANAQLALRDAKKFYDLYVTQKGYLTDSNYINDLKLLDKQEAQLTDDFKLQSKTIDYLRSVNSAYNDKAESMVFKLHTLLYVYDGAMNVTTIDNQRRILFNTGNNILNGEPDLIRTDLQPVTFKQEIELIKSWSNFITDLLKTNLNIGVNAYKLKQKINEVRLQKTELMERYCGVASGKVSVMESKIKELMDGENIMLSFNPIPVANVTTDADGNYSIDCPRKKGQILICNASRSVMNNTENYHWMIDVPTEYKSKINLNNQNLMDVESLLTEVK